MNKSKEYFGLKIISADFLEDALSLKFENGKSIKIWDDGQSCCEHRYMTTDDDVKSLIGHTLTRIDEKPGSSEPAGWDEHETMFIEVGTNQNFITITSHNEHNGFYGGFILTIDEVSA